MPGPIDRRQLAAHLRDAYIDIRTMSPEMRSEIETLIRENDQVKQGVVRRDISDLEQMADPDGLIPPSRLRELFQWLDGFDDNRSSRSFDLYTSDATTGAPQTTAGKIFAQLRRRLVEKQRLTRQDAARYYTQGQFDLGKLDTLSDVDRAALEHTGILRYLQGGAGSSLRLGRLQVEMLFKAADELDYDGCYDSLIVAHKPIAPGVTTDWDEPSTAQVDLPDPGKVMRAVHRLFTPDDATAPLPPGIANLLAGGTLAPEPSVEHRPQQPVVADPTSEPTAPEAAPDVEPEADAEPDAQQYRLDGDLAGKPAIERDEFTGILRLSTVNLDEIPEEERFELEQVVEANGRRLQWPRIVAAAGEDGALSGGDWHALFAELANLTGDRDSAVITLLDHKGELTPAATAASILLRHERRAQPEDDEITTGPAAAAAAPSAENQRQIVVGLAKGSKDRGNTGDVHALQAALKELGYEIDVDGDFGVRTETFLKTFQREYTALTGTALAASGVVDAATAQAIQDAISRKLFDPPPMTLPPPGDPPLIPVELTAGSADRGHVEVLQNALAELGYEVSIDGMLGDRTVALVEDFQRTYAVLTGIELPVDGGVDATTAAAIEHAVTAKIFKRLPDSLRKAAFEWGYIRGNRVPLVLRGIGGSYQIESQAALAFYVMHSEGPSISVNSAFRTMEEQKRMTRKYAGQSGRAARAGYSPHQNGIALDFAAGISWLDNNAIDYGWMCPRYGYTDSRGRRQVETWHWEYRRNSPTKAVRRSWRRRIGLQ